MEKLNDKQHFMLKLGRVQILKELSLLDAPEESVYNQFTRLASKIIGTPISLVSMVAANRQFFKSSTGLPEPVASERGTPLSHSFCQHVVANNEALIVSDARNDDLLKDNLAIPDLGVIGYLGIPLKLFDERTLGSFCAIDTEPREWTQTEIDIMTEFASIISKEFDLRAMTHNDSFYREELNELYEKMEDFFNLAVERLHNDEDESDMTKWNFLRWVQRWRLENHV